MRKFLVSLLVLMLLAAPAVSYAGVVRGGEEFRLGKNEVVSDDLYAASGNTVIQGSVRGDLLAAGGQVSIEGTVSEDANIAGGTVVLTGAVNDDVRVVGGRVEIEGRVGDDLAVAGGRVSILRDAVIGGSVSVASGKVIIDGTIRGDLKIAGGDVTINGTVKGKVEIAANRVIIGRTAMLDQGLSYRSHQEAEIEAGAQIIGKIDFKDTSEKVERHRKEFTGSLFAIFAILGLLKLAMFIVLVLAIVLLFRTIPSSIVEKMTNRFWTKAGTGFIVLVMVPVSIFVLFITILGIPLAILASLFYAIFIMFAYALGAIFLGAWIHGLIMQPAAPAVNWKTAIVGAIAWFILGNIPLVGWIIKFLLMLAGLGAITTLWYHNIQKNR